MNGPSRSRGWCFTCQRGASDLKTIATLLDAVDCHYMVYQEEVGAGGRHHIQGFCWWKTTRTFSSVQNKLPHGAHLEVQRGTNSEASAYCKKTGADGYFPGGVRGERGELPRDRGRQPGDLAAACATAYARCASDVFADDPAAYCKHHKGLEKIELLGLKARLPVRRPVQVYWLWGDAGSGKSHFAANWDSPEHTYIANDHKEGWLGDYAGERTLVLDEFDGLMPYNQIKNMLEGQKKTFPVKGGQVYGQWTTVFVTSNAAPSSYYVFNDHWDFSGRAPSPIQRRITLEFKAEGLHPLTHWTPHPPAPRPPPSFSDVSPVLPTNPEAAASSGKPPPPAEAHPRPEDEEEEEEEPPLAAATPRLQCNCTPHGPDPGCPVHDCPYPTPLPIISHDRSCACNLCATADMDLLFFQDFQDADDLQWAADIAEANEFARQELEQEGDEEPREGRTL